MRRRTMLGLWAAAVAALPVHAAPARPATAAPAGGDLTGVWTNAWYTHLERPAAFKALVATPAEAAAFEAPRKAHGGEIIDAPADVVGQNAAEFPDNGPGLARIHGELRSSWIVDPADGRVPWRPDAPAAARNNGQVSSNYDNPEARDTEERCLTNPGTAAPILNDHDANLVQFVQTGSVRAGGFLAIYGEKNDQVRVVRILPAGAKAQTDPREQGVTDWLGTSVGHWEGATLVVETTAFRPGITMVTRALQVSGGAKVTERFTRSPPTDGHGPEIAYDFVVTDPTLYRQPIRGEEVFRAAEGRMFEYACHEGNYGLPNILAGARALEAQAAGAKGK